MLAWVLNLGFAGGGTGPPPTPPASTVDPLPIPRKHYRGHRWGAIRKVRARFPLTIEQWPGLQLEAPQEPAQKQDEPESLSESERLYPTVHAQLKSVTAQRDAAFHAITQLKQQLAAHGAEIARLRIPAPTPVAPVGLSGAAQHAMSEHEKAAQAAIEAAERHLRSYQ